LKLFLEVAIIVGFFLNFSNIFIFKGRAAKMDVQFWKHAVGVY
jgi:hypothetical protein